MGKKSKRKGTNGVANTTTRTTHDPPQNSAITPTGSFCPSDGPSEEELACLQTSSSSLQAKLDQLAQLALSNDRAGFVSQFVPLDLSPADSMAYLQDLTTSPEADGQWRNLSSEITAMSAGRGVDHIEGDQVNNAVFYFKHPLLQSCDREVSFTCSRGEWRAEG
jgi:hypothetical protein